MQQRDQAEETEKASPLAAVEGARKDRGDPGHRGQTNPYRDKVATAVRVGGHRGAKGWHQGLCGRLHRQERGRASAADSISPAVTGPARPTQDRTTTRLNSSHRGTSF